MHMIATTVKRFTFEEFCRLVPDGQKADLIGGMIYMASPDNLDAGDLTALLLAVMRIYTERHRLGKVYVLRIAFRLSEFESPEPDIAFVSKKRLHLVRRGYVAGPPDAAMEIVSPESAERDYVLKRHQYREAGVPEYWIIDEENHLITLLRLDARGRYRKVRPRHGKYESQVMPGFFLRPEWLWQDPLPETEEMLNWIEEENASET